MLVDMIPVARWMVVSSLDLFSPPINSSAADWEGFDHNKRSVAYSR
jgi:hypothetical protein